MLAPGVKIAIPLGSALLGALTFQNLALYFGVTVTFGSLIAVNGLIASAKAWRERAEARADEAMELRLEKSEMTAKLEKLADELALRPDLRELEATLKQIRGAGAEEHQAIMAAVERLGASIASSVERNTIALKSLAELVPWADIIEARERGEQR